MNDRAEWRNIYIVDFEASDLHGWPIEVGVGNVVSGNVSTWLIRPSANWRTYPWSRSAQRLHGLTPSMLEEMGEEAVVVARALHAIVMGGRIIADSPTFDGRWLSMLFDTASLPSRPVVDVGTMLRERFESNTIAASRRRVLAGWEAARRRIHRAGADVVQHLCVIAECLGLPEPSTAVDEHAPARRLSRAMLEAVAAGEPLTKVWREALGWSLERAAQESGVRVDEIEAIEVGGIGRGDELYRLAAAFRIEISDLDPRP